MPSPPFAAPSESNQMTALSSPSEHDPAETPAPSSSTSSTSSASSSSSDPSPSSTLAPPSVDTLSSPSTCTSPLPLALTQVADNSHLLDPPAPPLPAGELVLLNGESTITTQPLTLPCLDPPSPSSDTNLIPTALIAPTMSSSLTNIPNNNGVNNPSETEHTGISDVPRTEGNDDRNETTLHTDDTVQQAARAVPTSQDEEGLTDRRRRAEEAPPTTDGLDSTLITVVLLTEEDDHLSNHSPPSGQRDQNHDSNSSNAKPLSLVQVLSSPTSLAESAATASTSTTVVCPSESDNGQGASSQQQQKPSTPRRCSRDIPPLLNLPPTTFSTMFTSAYEPPPYSPTHTILPHYFELEPIPVRTYIIKDSTGVPFLYDFWLISTTQSSPSRPQSVLLQERGLSPQHQAELKYSIIRPQHTDRTALPITGATNAYFIPALALVADHYPSRWIWWGTEALQMVVFGRQHKNVIMEWRWRHGRTRIGGPVVHRLVGASFQITPDRKFCWKIGSGKSTTTTAQEARNRLQQQQRQSRTFGGSTRPLNQILSTPQGGGSLEGGVGGGGGGWFGSFFARPRQPTRPDANPAETSPSSTANIALNSVLVHTPTTPPFSIPELVTAQENLPLSEQESAIDRMMDDDDEDDDEVGCYHCREESSTGFLGRIVAVYRPGRPANRARDRPASSRRLEIFTEVGERCETAMMLMCIRLDDLFMSLPAQKKGPFVTSRSAGGGGGGIDGTAGGQQQQITTAGVNGNINEANEGGIGGAEGEGGATGDGLDQGGTNVQSLATSSRSSISFTKRLIGTRRDWLFRLKWVIAAVLIAVVLVLVLKRKKSTPA
ncbi:hypothetical protein BGZ47_002482 [Haplosporangium gracile]|nr:hypothetical protein BGZ47_002482 [Haplosporangium gracile]